MVSQALRCERHGESTRLTCVDCGHPICPKCLVRTEVGLKCEPCAQPAAPTPSLAPRSRRPAALAVAGAAALAALAAVLLLRPSGQEPAPAPLPPTGRWLDVPDLAAIRGTTAAAVLEDGNVLVAGGGVGAIPLPAAELYDPVAGQWRPAAGLAQARRGHQGVMLRDGRVLVVGGFAQGELLSSAEVYDPATGRWSATGAMSIPRLGHSLTVLADGRVLAPGGTTVGAAEAAGEAQAIRPEASAEIYDPKAGTWTGGGAMGAPRFEHTATLLGDGRVLMTGGQGPVDGRLGPLGSTELYDPAADAFVRSNDLGEGRANHAAVLLPDRSVLVTGGVGGPNGDVSLASAEVFDPREGSWTRVAPLAEARSGHTATLLSDGRVLVAGGESATRGARRSLASAEVFDIGGRQWRSAGKMRCPRSEQAAALLRDGTVLVVAGDAAFPARAPIAQSCADRYQPTVTEKG